MQMRSLARQLREDARFYARLRAARGTTVSSWRALGDRGWWLLVLHRVTASCMARANLVPFGLLLRLVAHASYFLAGVCFKSDIAGRCRIAGCVYLANEGYLTCGARSVGAGTLIHGFTTIGYATGEDARPTIGSNVWIGPNCIVAGDITIGDGATILPESFVTFSVSAGALVGGNPARVIRRGFDNSALRSSLQVAGDAAASTW